MHPIRVFSVLGIAIFRWLFERDKRELVVPNESCVVVVGLEQDIDN